MNGKTGTTIFVGIGIAVAVAVSLGGCMDASLSHSERARADIELQNVPDGVEEISISVTGPGMNTVEETFGRDTDAVVLEIPTGPDRKITVEAGPHIHTRVREVNADGTQISVRFYQVGDAGPAGGYIFFVAQDAQQAEDLGFSYMEAAPEETGWTDLAWAEVPDQIGADAQDPAIGAGPDNTKAIVDALGQDTASAALRADNLEVNGYDDWFMPSDEELLRMYENLYLEGLGGLATEGGTAEEGPYSYYWSSTEDGEFQVNDPGDAAFVLDFVSGPPSFSLLKDASFEGDPSIITTVRAVRRF